ncbi:hypothetical protein CUMW_196580 [Citrus unshiu]|uniref:Uncharacterized protein n=1 Tax=Citrus unshiu TaxID=55188 RepID=A0A2H5Q4Z4_CITUN|nr:hypothetical protein CUMW_196580 [Citrus unshiu]
MGSETQMTPTQISDEEANLFAMQLTSASSCQWFSNQLSELDLLEIIAKAGQVLSCLQNK